MIICNATAEFATPIPGHLRRSLSRGLAREAFASAQSDDGDMARLLETSFSMTQNIKNRQRIAARMKRLPGVVSVARFGDGLCAVLRTQREMILTDDEGEHFREQILLYTHVTFARCKGGMDFTMKRISFSAHALERLVQRSDCPLKGLLGQVDAEALSILRTTWEQTGDGRSYQDALCEGVWAGQYDSSEVGTNWPLRYRTEQDRRIPTFSVRTFLSPEEMNPVVWLGWQGDDSIAMAS